MPAASWRISCSFSRNSSFAWLASASSDETLRLWNPVSGRELRVLHGHTAAINAVATDDYVAIAQGDTLVVINQAGTSFTATYTVVPVAGAPASFADLIVVVESLGF